MKNLIFAAAMSCMVCACGQQAADTGNPFLSEFETLMEHRTLTVSRWNIMSRLS